MSSTQKRGFTRVVLIESDSEDEPSASMDLARIRPSHALPNPRYRTTANKPVPYVPSSHTTATRVAARALRGLNGHPRNHVTRSPGNNSHNLTHSNASNQFQHSKRSKHVSVSKRSQNLTKSKASCVTNQPHGTHSNGSRVSFSSHTNASKAPSSHAMGTIHNNNKNGCNSNNCNDSSQNNQNMQNIQNIQNINISNVNCNFTSNSDAQVALAVAASLRDHVAELERDKKSLQSDKQALISQIAREKEITRAYEQKMKSLECEKEDLKLQASKVADARTNALCRLHKLQSDFSEMEQKKNETETELNTVKNHYKTVRNELKDLNKKNCGLDTKIRVLESEKKETLEKIEKAQKMNLSLQKNLQHVRELNCKETQKVFELEGDTKVKEMELKASHENYSKLERCVWNYAENCILGPKPHQEEVPLVDPLELLSNKNCDIVKNLDDLDLNDASNCIPRSEMLYKLKKKLERKYVKEKKFELKFHEKYTYYKKYKRQVETYLKNNNIGYTGGNSKKSGKSRNKVKNNNNKNNNKIANILNPIIEMNGKRYEQCQVLKKETWVKHPKIKALDEQHGVVALVNIVEGTVLGQYIGLELTISAFQFMYVETRDHVKSQSYAFEVGFDKKNGKRIVTNNKKRMFRTHDSCNDLITISCAPNPKRRKLNGNVAKPGGSGAYMVPYNSNSSNNNNNSSSSSSSTSNSNLNSNSNSNSTESTPEEEEEGNELDENEFYYETSMSDVIDKKGKLEISSIMIDGWSMYNSECQGKQNLVLLINDGRKNILPEPEIEETAQTAEIDGKNGKHGKYGKNGKNAKNAKNGNKKKKKKAREEISNFQNVEFVMVSVNNWPCVLVVAKEDICAGDEIFGDYGPKYVNIIKTELSWKQEVIDACKKTNKDFRFAKMKLDADEQYWSARAE